MKKVVIVDAKRSAIGSFGGSLKDVSAVSLGVYVIKNLLHNLNLTNEIDEIIVGQVLDSGEGQSNARQILIKSGISESKSAFNVNKVCGSGMKAIELAYNSIVLGDNDVVIAGGTESMSLSPFLLKDRFGGKFGNKTLIDSLINDGLTCSINQVHMGVTAEAQARKYNINRNDMDEFSLNSHIKASKASKSVFKDEIIPIPIKVKKETVNFETDEFIRHDASLESLAKLRPAFEEGGIVTAGNSSGINDGAAFLVLMSEEKAKNLGLKPLAHIKSFGKTGLDPMLMGLGPVNASLNALKKIGLEIKDIDLIEINEAFAAQSLAVQRELKIDSAKLNVNGGAIALGHPIGASGARIMVTLLHEMQRRNTKFGLASLCIGGGQGIACVVEKD